jgi:hypothetical protein
MNIVLYAVEKALRALHSVVTLSEQGAPCPGRSDRPSSEVVLRGVNTTKGTYVQVPWSFELRR